MTNNSICLLLSLILFVTTGTTHSDSSDDSLGSSSSSSSESNECSSCRYEYKVTETVKVDLYYESLCPDCRLEYPELLRLVKDLGAYINLQTYPYGNARMHEENGNIVVKCQHGEPECYGNKLHACAIDYTKGNVTAYVEYNACLMTKESDDPAADACGQTVNIDSDVIKSCAKGKKGEDLLIQYGKASEAVGFQYVPYVLINSKEKLENETLKNAVCHAFKNPPAICTN